MRLLIVTFLGVVTTLGPLAMTGCGDDNGGGSGGDNAGGASGGGTGGSSAGACTTTGPVSDPASCSGGTPIFDGCKMDCVSQADAEAQCKATSAETAPGPTDDPTCGAGCTCTKCTQEMIDCANDPEAYCAVILKCANEKNCSGVGCYTPATCQAEVDGAPGGLTSLSVALSIAVSDCVAGVKDPAITCLPKCP